MLKGKAIWIVGFTSACMILIGIWWWQWQAPYRTLIVFLRALQEGDINTLYALSLDKERELGLTKESVERIYHSCLKPALSHRRIVKIERQDKRLLIREASISFLLWFEGLNRPIVVGVTRWPGTRKWRISFSAFAMSIARFLVLKDDLQRYKFFKNFGLKFRVGPLGTIEDIDILIMQANLKSQFR
jgi:hypothetical protein